jgi:hypothetical protein
LARWPQILPGGKFVMYTASTGAGADRAVANVRFRDAGRITRHKATARE